MYNINSPNFNTVFDGVTAIKQWSHPNKRYEIFWLYAMKSQKLSMLHSCPNFKTSGDYAFIPILIANCKKIVMIDYVGYNYTCNNYDSLTHIAGYEKNRAINFLKAYKYLTENMHQIEKEYKQDFRFFYEDWRGRLQSRYNLLSDALKDELKNDFEQELNKQ